MPKPQLKPPARGISLTLIRYGDQEETKWQDGTLESGDGFPERENPFRTSEQAKNFQHIAGVSLAFWLPVKNPS